MVYVFEIGCRYDVQLHLRAVLRRLWRTSSYHGTLRYATVLIGEQCFIAEKLKDNELRERRKCRSQASLKPDRQRTGQNILCNLERMERWLVASSSIMDTTTARRCHPAMRRGRWTIIFDSVYNWN